MQFMAFPSYAYLQLKMPSLHGTVTMHDSAQRELEAEVATLKHAEATWASTELEAIKKTLNPSATFLMRKPKPGPALLPGQQTKKFQVYPEDPSKTTIIGGDLSLDQEASLMQFLRDKPGHL